MAVVRAVVKERATVGESVVHLHEGFHVLAHVRVLMDFDAQIDARLLEVLSAFLQHRLVRNCAQFKQTDAQPAFNKSEGSSQVLALKTNLEIELKHELTICVP